MKYVKFEEYYNNIHFIKEMFYKIGLIIGEELVWNVLELQAIAVDCGDYSGIGLAYNDSRERVYLFQEKILNEHAVTIRHKELMNLFDDISTIYDGIFIATINGHQNRISVLEGDIISIDGDIEDYF